MVVCVCVCVRAWGGGCVIVSLSLRSLTSGLNYCSAKFSSCCKHRRFITDHWRKFEMSWLSKQRRTWPVRQIKITDITDYARTKIKSCTAHLRQGGRAGRRIAINTMAATQTRTSRWILSLTTDISLGSRHRFASLLHMAKLRNLSRRFLESFARNVDF
jgi:hypothetical protein